MFGHSVRIFELMPKTPSPTFYNWRSICTTDINTTKTQAIACRPSILMDIVLGHAPRTTISRQEKTDDDVDVERRHLCQDSIVIVAASCDGNSRHPSNSRVPPTSILHDTLHTRPVTTNTSSTFDPRMDRHSANTKTGVSTLCIRSISVRIYTSTLYDSSKVWVFIGRWCVYE